jgi:hypothetical protein
MHPIFANISACNLVRQSSIDLFIRYPDAISRHSAHVFELFALNHFTLS